MFCPYHRIPAFGTLRTSPSPEVQNKIMEEVQNKIMEEIQIKIMEESTRVCLNASGRDLK